MKSAITICLVPEAGSGPFVCHDGLAAGCERAARLGFDGVEIFARSADQFPVAELRRLLRTHRLQAAAFGTGAGWLCQQLSLTAADAKVRKKALQFVEGIIDLAAGFHAPAIIGSLQGRVEPGGDRDQTLAWLAQALEALSRRAAKKKLPVLFEPLNRYETNVFNRLEDTAQWLRQHGLDNVKLLADMFHMNIEETDSAVAVRKTVEQIGHVHFADSNRQAVGLGQTNAPAIIKALREGGYDGFLSAEVLPLPNPETTATVTINSFRRLNLHRLTETRPNSVSNSTS